MQKETQEASCSSAAATGMGEVASTSASAVDGAEPQQTFLEHWSSFDWRLFPGHYYDIRTPGPGSSSNSSDFLACLGLLRFVNEDDMREHDDKKVRKSVSAAVLQFCHTLLLYLRDQPNADELTPLFRMYDFTDGSSVRDAEPWYDRMILPRKNLETVFRVSATEFVVRVRFQYVLAINVMLLKDHARTLFDVFRQRTGYAVSLNECSWSLQLPPLTMLHSKDYVTPAQLFGQLWAFGHTVSGIVHRSPRLALSLFDCWHEHHAEALRILEHPVFGFWGVLMCTMGRYISCETGAPYDVKRLVYASLRASILREELGWPSRMVHPSSGGCVGEDYQYAAAFYELWLSKRGAREAERRGADIPGRMCACARPNAACRWCRHAVGCRRYPFASVDFFHHVFAHNESQRSKRAWRDMLCTHFARERVPAMQHVPKLPRAIPVSTLLDFFAWAYYYGHHKNKNVQAPGTTVPQYADVDDAVVDAEHMEACRVEALEFLQRNPFDDEL